MLTDFIGKAHFFLNRMKGLSGASKTKIIHHADSRTIQDMYDMAIPVFFLSTGRCGTGYLYKLFSQNKQIAAYHEAKPGLQFFCNYCFHNQHKPEVLKQMFDSARMELILSAYLNNKLYLETNHCLVFYAPAIKTLYRNAKFVHLTRHPGNFIRSAIMKGWYRNDTIWEMGRIKPEDADFWSHLSEIEKLAWLWKETNQFIEMFKKSLRDQSRFLRVSFEELTQKPSTCNQLTEFLNVETFSDQYLKKSMKKKVNELFIGKDEPPNLKKTSDYPPFDEWDEKMKNQLIRFAGRLSQEYGYEIE